MHRVYVTCSGHGKESSLSPVPARAQGLCPRPLLPEVRLALLALAGVCLRTQDSAVKIARFRRFHLSPSQPPPGFCSQRRSETAHRGGPVTADCHGGEAAAADKNRVAWLPPSLAPDAS